MFLFHGTYFKMAGISFRNKSNFLNLIPPKWGQSPFEFEFSMLHHWYLNIDFVLRSRGWCIKFATGLNIIISLVQKVYEWPGCYFAKMILQCIAMGGSFWQKNSLIFHMLFELCLLWCPVLNLMHHSLVCIVLINYILSWNMYERL